MQPAHATDARATDALLALVRSNSVATFDDFDAAIAARTKDTTLVHYPTIGLYALITPDQERNVFMQSLQQIRTAELDWNA